MTTTEHVPTPAELRAEAAEVDARIARSVEQSDTDGFLSQFASGLTAQKLRAEAALIEAGGTREVPALFNLDGTVASTHYGRGQFGPYWVLNDAATMRFGKRFVSPSRAQKAATRRRNLRGKGFTIGTIRVDARVEIVGSGTGLSGMASCYVAVVASIDALKAGDFEIISADSDYDEHDTVKP